MTSISDILYLILLLPANRLQGQGDRQSAGWNHQARVYLDQRLYVRLQHPHLINLRATTDCFTELSFPTRPSIPSRPTITSTWSRTAKQGLSKGALRSITGGMVKLLDMIHDYGVGAHLVEDRRDIWSGWKYCNTTGCPYRVSRDERCIAMA